MKVAAFFAMALVWGLTWIAVKLATAGTPPIFVAGTRLVLAGGCYLLWSLAARYPLRLTLPLRTVASALLINTCCYSFLFWGVVRAPSGLAAIVNFALIPLLSMGIGALYGEERISRKRVLAVGLGAVGLAVLFATGDPEGDAAVGREAALGLGAVAVATLSYVWGAIVSKPLVRAGAPVALAFWQTTIGGVALLGVSLAVEDVDRTAMLNLAGGLPLAGLAFLVLFGSLVGFSIYLWLLREWGAFRASLYAFVSPAVAVTVGVVWAGERFGRHEALGMAILLGAAALAIEPRRKVIASS